MLHIIRNMMCITGLILWDYSLGKMIRSPLKVSSTPMNINCMYARIGMLGSSMCMVGKLSFMYSSH